MRDGLLLLLPKLPTYEGTLYRGMDGSLAKKSSVSQEQYEKRLQEDPWTPENIEKSFVVGQVRCEKGFTSTSMLSFCQQKAESSATNSYVDRRCLKTIKSKTGRIVHHFTMRSTNKSKWEVLFMPGTKFKVTGIESKYNEKVGVQYRITIEEI